MFSLYLMEWTSTVPMGLSSQILVECLLWDLDGSFRPTPHHVWGNPEHITHPPGEVWQGEVVTIQLEVECLTVEGPR